MNADDVRAGAITVIETTADVGLTVRADSINQLFDLTALGLFGLITDLTSIQPEREEIIELESESIDILLVKWLNYLIYLFDGEGKLFNVFSCNVCDNKLLARCRGQSYDPRKHELYEGIKAATYHRLRVVHKVTGWEADVIFDL